MKKIIIVGGVAAGATAAARARRLCGDCEITIIERGAYVSYANCGLPYFISGDIQKRSKLLLQTKEGFLARYRVNVLLNTDAVEIQRAQKKLKVISEGVESLLEYDSLILAQGGKPFIPNIQGKDLDHVFSLWTVPDTDAIQAFIAKNNPKTVAVIGGGFIGLEMAEAFSKRGIKTHIVELQKHIMPMMDSEFSTLAEKALKENGLELSLASGLERIEEKAIYLSGGTKIDADLVLLSIGVRAELILAKNAGIELASNGSVIVDEYLKTSDDSIYASGDMIEVTHKVSGSKVRMPLAGPANRQGRIAASNALGMRLPYNGALGTSAVKIFDYTLASTGLTEKAALDAKINAGTAIIVKDHHASYYPGAEELTMKLVYNIDSGKILGAQAFGKAGVDKRIDVIAMAIQGKLTVDDLAEVDLAYAPPYSSANDPVNLLGFIAQNAISGYSPTISAKKLFALMKEALETQKHITILDVRNRGEFEAGHIKGSSNIPLDEIEDNLDSIPKSETLYLLCRSGFRAHVALRKFAAMGIKAINVTGGFLAVQNEDSFTGEYIEV